jgi:translocation and assembly module TamB
MFDAVPERDRLAIKLAIDAPADGVIAALGGWREAVTVRADGKGDWRKWDGAVAADLGRKPLVRLVLAARAGQFHATGPARIGAMLRGTPAALLGDSTRLDLTAAFARRRATVGGELRSDALVLRPAGVIDLGRGGFDRLRINLALLRPGAIAPNLAGNGVQGQLQLDGAFARPVVRYRLAAARLSAGAVVLEGFAAQGAARVEADQIVIPLSATLRRVSGLDSMAGGALGKVHLDGRIAVDGSRILSDKLRVKADRIDATLVLLGDVARGFYTGALDGRINRYRVDSVGMFDLRTAARLQQAAGGFALTGQIHARSTQLTDPGVRDFLGGNAVGTAQLAYARDGVLRMTGLRVSAPLLQVTGGHGSYAPGGRITLTASGQSARYGALGLELSGSVATPKAVVIAARPGLGLGLADLRAEVTRDAAGYRLAADGQTDYGPLSADVTLLHGSGPLTLRINRGDLAGIGFSGQLVRTANGPFAGRLEARGQGVNGIVRLGPAGRYQELQVDARARDTVLPGSAGLAIGEASIVGRAVLLPQPTVVADVQLSQTHVRALDLAAARVLIDYRDGRGRTKLLAEGTSGGPFRVAATAELAPGLWRAVISGRMRGIAFHTASPARVVPGHDGYELLPTRFEFDRGSLRLSGTYGIGERAGRLKLASRMDGFDLALLNPLVPGYGMGGSVTGSLDFEQASRDAFPQAEARLAVRGFTRTTALSVSQPVDVNVIAKLLSDGGEARAVIRQQGNVIGRLVAGLRPLGPGAGDWQTRLRAAPLSGGIRYNGPAETAWSFSGQASQALVGAMAIGVDFSGRVQQPQLTGIVRGENLTYENQNFGTRLTNLAVAAKFAGDRIQIEQFAATAGSGKVSGQGYLSLASESGYPIDLAVDLDNARLARSNALSTAATGHLRLTKQAGETALVSGTLQLPETRYQLVRQGAAQVPELTGVRFASSRGRMRISGNERVPPKSSVFDGLRLDIGLTAANQLYVTGMGLESEWSARLQVTGTGTHPRLSGDVALVRGSLGFAGRQFELQEGRLLFTGGEVVDPQITLSASEDIGDVAVSVTVSGRSLNPQISFGSNPALPADEILSRILFGNSVGQLSPLQGLQLAASLNSLRATGGRLNPLGKLRAATGVSRLRILAPDEQATNGVTHGTAIAAGRYLTNNIYLELLTDARGWTVTQVEVSLSKVLSVLSEAGGTGVNSFNVRYKKRY